MTLSDDSRSSDNLDIADGESEILDAYEAGHLKSVATKEELARLEAAASAAAMGDRRDLLGSASD